MEDRVMMDNILSTTKGMCDLLMHGSIESSTPNVHSAFQTSLNECLSMQNEIYNKMSQKGWYSAEQAPQQKVDSVKQKFHKG